MSGAWFAAALRRRRRVALHVGGATEFRRSAQGCSAVRDTRLRTTRLGVVEGVAYRGRRRIIARLGCAGRRQRRASDLRGRTTRGRDLVLAASPSPRGRPAVNAGEDVRRIGCSRAVCRDERRRLGLQRCSGTLRATCSRPTACPTWLHSRCQAARERWRANRGSDAHDGRAMVVEEGGPRSGAEGGESDVARFAGSC